MRGIISNVQAGLAWVTLVAVIAQFLLAGIGIFDAGSFQAHRIVGYLIGLAAVLLLPLALAGRLGQARIGLSAVLLALVILQIALVTSGQPWIEALHPVNALAVLGVSANLARLGAAPARRPGRATAPDHAVS